MKNNNTIDTAMISKQNEAIHLCYDRLLEKLRNGESETSIAKCIEIIRKDMVATLSPNNSKQNTLTDTNERVLEIIKRIEELK